MSPQVYKDAKGNLLQVIALAGLDGAISIWFTNRARAVAVFTGVFGAQVLDLSWFGLIFFSSFPDLTFVQVP